MSWLEQFLENLTEKKTTFFGFVAIIIALLPLVFPNRISPETAEEISGAASGGYDLLIQIIAFAGGIGLLISRIFPKKE